MLSNVTHNARNRQFFEEMEQHSHLGSPRVRTDYETLLNLRQKLEQVLSAERSLLEEPH